MGLFRYTVTDEAGRRYAGLVEAENDAAAEELLVAEGYTVRQLDRAGQPKRSLGSITLFERVTAKDRVALSRQLATLVSSSLPLVEALETLGRQTKKRGLQSVLLDVARSVEGGERLSESLAAHPKVFNQFYVKLVETGEQVGKLDEVLEYLATEEEKSYDLRSRIRNMLIYPSFVLSVLVVIVLFMLAFVMPRMLQMLQETDVALPLTTQLLISLSDFFQVWWWAVLLGIGAVVGGVGLSWQTPGGQKFWSKLLLKIPILKNVIQAMTVVRFSNSLSILLQGGVDLVSALHSVAGVLDNHTFREMTTDAAIAVEDGNPLADTLEQSGLLPIMVVEMIRVGERVGHLEMTLEKIADFYTREVQNTVTTLVNLIEPSVIIIMGVGVGVVVSAMILPMYRLVGSL